SPKRSLAHRTMASTIQALVAANGVAAVRITLYLRCEPGEILSEIRRAKRKGQSALRRNCPLATSALSELDVQRLFQLLKFPFKVLNLLGHIQPGLYVGKNVRYHAGQLFLSLINA